MNGPKNIAEYVGNAVIKEIGYKEEKIANMEKEISDMLIALENYNIIRCVGCKNFSDYQEQCIICKFKCCGDCYVDYMEHVSTKNLGDLDLCKKCFLDSCGNCYELPDRSNEYCSDCE